MAGTDQNLTDLVNRALVFLGEKRITNTDSPESRAGKMLVDISGPCRREVLRRVSWNFAETWASLNYFGAAPQNFDYQDLYALPDDYIRVVDLPNMSVKSAIGLPQSIEDYRLIVMNNNGGQQRCIALNNNAANTLPMCYIADVTNLSIWDPLALKVLAMWMALDVAKGVTGQDGLVQQLSEQLTLDLQDAVGVNGNEQRKRRQTFSNVQKDRELAYLGYSSYFTPVTGYVPDPN
ncbi:MAG: hypothetical protein KGI50_06020 [Patescibacteria group bacterium]|nr:hypothetical protein [Patescibacteria group bacterium]